MAENAERFSDALVFVYSRNDVLIAKTAVLGFNRGKLFIKDTEGLKGVKLGTGLHLLILHASGASEMSGTLRKTHEGVCIISIHDERSRDVRTSVRHTINTSAVISDMVIGDEAETLEAPIPVMIENMSTSGVLLKSQDARLEIGALLQVEFNANGRTGILYGEVVREQKPTDKDYRYGCQLHFFNK